MAHSTRHILIAQKIICSLYVKLLTKMLRSAPPYGPLCFEGNWWRKKKAFMFGAPSDWDHLPVHIHSLHLDYLNIF